MRVSGPRVAFCLLINIVRQGLASAKAPRGALADGTRPFYHEGLVSASLCIQKISDRGLVSASLCIQKISDRGLASASLCIQKISDRGLASAPTGGSCWRLSAYKRSDLTYPFQTGADSGARVGVFLHTKDQ